MARRTRKKNTKSNPIPMIVGSVVVLAILGAGFMFLNSKPADSLKSLPIDIYYNDPSSIRGSKFSLTGEVISKRRYDSDIGQVIEVKATDGSRSEVFAVMVPKDVKGPNIDPKQNYIFNVEVGADRWLEAFSYTDR